MFFFELQIEKTQNAIKMRIKSTIITAPMAAISGITTDSIVEGAVVVRSTKEVASIVTCRIKYNDIILAVS